jgi:hypothetical protein
VAQTLDLKVRPQPEALFNRSLLPSQAARMPKA